MIDDRLPIIRQVHHIERMQQGAPSSSPKGERQIPVLQDEDDSGRDVGRGGNDGVKAEGCMFHIGIPLHVSQQVQSELIQPQVHDIDARVHILQIDHFLLKSLQLSLAVIQIRLLLVRQQDIAVAGTGDVHPRHARFHTPFQAEVVVQLDVRPVVHQLNHLVARANTIDTTESLNDAHGVPVNIIINKVVAVLKVLTFGDTVRGNQDVNLLLLIWQQLVSLFRYGREQCENRIELCRYALDRGSDTTAGNKPCVQPCFLHDDGCEVLVEVFCRIGESREDKHFLVVAVDGMGKLIAQVLHEHLQLAVVLGRDVAKHDQQQADDFLVGYQVALPRAAIHVGQRDTGFLSAHEEVVLTLVAVQHTLYGLQGKVCILPRFEEEVNGLQRLVYLLFDARKGQSEAVDRGLQSLQQIDGHEFLQSLFAP